MGCLGEFGGVWGMGCLREFGGVWGSLGGFGGVWGVLKSLRESWWVGRWVGGTKIENKELGTNYCYIIL